MSSSELEFNKIEWDNDNEELMRELAEKAMIYRLLFQIGYNFYNVMNIFFQIPIIIISGGASLLSFVSDKVPLLQFPIIVGVISFFGGVLSTISNYLQVAQTTENHRMSEISFSKLSRNIQIVLSLKRDERPQFNAFLSYVKSEYNRIIETSVELNEMILRRFKKKFPQLDNKISIPEILGKIKPIKINSTILRRYSEAVIDTHIEAMRQVITAENNI